jgi:hypothetical protein
MKHIQIMQIPAENCRISPLLLLKKLETSLPVGCSAFRKKNQAKIHSYVWLPKHMIMLKASFAFMSRETSEGWPLPVVPVETKASGNSWSTKERGPSLVGS